MKKPELKPSEYICSISVSFTIEDMPKRRISGRKENHTVWVVKFRDWIDKKTEEIQKKLDNVTVSNSFDMSWGYTFEVEVWDTPEDMSASEYMDSRILEIYNIIHNGK